MSDMSRDLSGNIKFQSSDNGRIVKKRSIPGPKPATWRPPRELTPEERADSELALDIILRRSTASELAKRATTAPDSWGSAEGVERESGASEPQRSLAQRALPALLASQTELDTSEPLHFIIAGGGPTGLQAAIGLYRQGMKVTVVESRTGYGSPIVWNLRTKTGRDVINMLDPELFKKYWNLQPDGSVLTNNDVHVIDFIDWAYIEPIVDGRALPINAPRNPARPNWGTDPYLREPDRLTFDPRRTANDQSAFQVMATKEVALLWSHLEELAAKDAAKGEKRLELLRGWEASEFPTEDGNRRVVVTEMKEVLQRGSDPRNPDRDAAGEVEHRPYTGGPVPEGWSRVRVPSGVTRDLGVPHKGFVSTGASATPVLEKLGVETQLVGPSTRYISGLAEGNLDEHDRPPAGGFQGESGGVRRWVVVEEDRALRPIALSPHVARAIWGLIEVDPRLNFGDPKSIESWFGRSLTPKEAVTAYYTQKLSELSRRYSAQEIAQALIWGPHLFTLQSRVSGPVAADAQNMTLLGDSRGNSHFLTSLGRVMGGEMQIAIRRYVESIQSGTDDRVASALLDRRLDACIRAWLVAGLSEFTEPGGVNLGAIARGRVQSALGGRVFEANQVDDTAVADLGADPTVPDERWISIADALREVFPEIEPVPGTARYRLPEEHRSVEGDPDALIIYKDSRSRLDPVVERLFLTNTTSDLGTLIAGEEIQAVVQEEKGHYNAFPGAADIHLYQSIHITADDPVKFGRLLWDAIKRCVDDQTSDRPDRPALTFDRLAVGPDSGLRSKPEYVGAPRSYQWWGSLEGHRPVRFLDESKQLVELEPEVALAHDGQSYNVYFKGPIGDEGTEGTIRLTLDVKASSPAGAPLLSPQDVKHLLRNEVSAKLRERWVEVQPRRS